MLEFLEALRSILVVCLYLIVIIAAAGGLVTVVAIAVGVIFACKDSAEQKKIDRLGDRMMEQAEQGLRDREEQKT